MTKADRRMRRLIEILRLRSYVSIKELSQILAVSEMTIRRDLKHLEASSTIKNVNGTLVYNESKNDIEDEQHYNLLDEVDKHRASKTKIGRLAASLIEAGDIVVIDTGTTTEKIVPALPLDRNLTVLCYNINILIDLYRNPGVNMLFAGGYYYPNTQMFSSEQGVQFIKGVRAQKAFISAAGIHSQLGITCANAYEVQTKQAVMKSSIQKILVADSSKFGIVRSAYFGELDQFSDIVTDEGLSDEWRQVIAEMGIGLHLA